MSLPGLAVKRPIATSMLLLMAVLLGVVSLSRLEVTLLPEVKSQRLLVWIGWPDAGVLEIEESIARPAEEALVSARGVRGVRTRIVPGGAALTVLLHSGVDPELAGLGVRERLDTIRWMLPDESERPLLLGTSNSDSPDMILALAADDLPGAADWARTILKPRLEQVDGVARAQIVGAPVREIQVIPDIDRMSTLGISSGDIATALEAANVPAPGGTIRRRGIRYALQFNSELRTAREVGRVVVADGELRPVRVADLATVVDGFEEPRGWSRLDRRPAVGLLIYRESGKNLVDMSQQVQDQLVLIRSDFPGFQVDIVADSSPFVRQSMAGVWQSVIWGGLLAFLVLVFFLRDVRSPLLLAVALPVSVVTTFAFLELFGVSLNLMSLGGIALGVGMLVDNGIICLENIHRLRQEGLKPDEAAARGAEEISLPILASTLTTCAVFVPLAFLSGTVGALFRDQAIAVAASLGVSLLVALTLLPMAASRIETSLGRTEFLPMYGRYHRLLTLCLRRPGAVLGIVAVLLAASVTLLADRPREMLPPLSTDQLAISLRMPPGTDVAATDAAATDIEFWLEARPEIERVFLTVGAAGALDPSDAGQRSNRAVIRARLKDGRHKQRSGLVADLQNHFESRHDWDLTLLTDRPELAAVFPAGEAAIRCEVQGPDAKQAEEYARNLAVAANRHLQAEGLALRIAATEMEPRFVLKPKEDVWWRLGLSEREILDAFQARTSGLESTRIRRFQEEFGVVIRPNEAANPASGTLLVGGRVFPVRSLFDVVTVLSPARLLRVDQSRLAAINWDGPLRDVRAVKEALDAARREVEIPGNYIVRYSGEYAEMQRTLKGILAALSLSGGLVLLILSAQFESLRLPLLIFAAVPLSLVGVAVTLFLTRGTINVFSGIGLVVLVGVVVNDSILKVDLLRRLREGGASVGDAVHEASRRRYRPIIMTTLTTALALSPLFFGSGSEFRAPLAATVIGGLVASTFLTLLVIPVIFKLTAGRTPIGESL